MAIYHVHFVCAPDYMARRLPFRPAHLKQLASLRDDGRVVAGGPEPDGTAANIFYRVVDRAELDRLLAENEFNRAGLFTANRPRSFADFVEARELPPVDAGLSAIIVEGAPGDRAKARAGLNNYTILHSRTGFVDGPEPHQKRHMLRLWLKFPTTWPLSPEFPAHMGSKPSQDTPILVEAEA